jgi:two-component system, OmpR family, sensor histidine kinase KdpD
MNDPTSDIESDPDQILHFIRLSEERASKGKLKVFLGMCAGSGKTYSMLKAAQQLKTDGADVVVGYVETHGRVETEALTEGLEIVPRFCKIYKDISLTEMDLDTILRRKPQIVLVDELAHTNIPESRHLKRYQDIEELLNQGIGVYTTLNVQHLESRSETVEEITGIPIREKVPDSFLQYAEIELIDVTPDILLKRLSEGKIYIPEKAINASKNFFRKGNLHALREMALRFTAERVDIDLLEYMRTKNINTTWKTTEKLMVAVGPSPASQKLIRWTRRMAYNLGAQWIAVSIDLGEDQSRKVKELTNRNLELARELGAKIIQITDYDVVTGIQKVALQYNVTQVVVGKTNEHPLRNYLNGGSIVDRLLKNGQNIDIYVVNTCEQSNRPPLFRRSKIQRHNWKEYLSATLAMLLLGLLCYPVRDYIGYQTVGLLFLLGISALSLNIGRLPIVYAALLGSLVWDFFFIPPQFTFHINSLHDVITLIANFVVALTGGTLLGRLRKNQRSLQKSQENIRVLFSILENLNNAMSIKEVVSRTRKELKRNFHADAILYLRDKDEILLKLDSNGFGNLQYDSVKEFSIASWVFENRKQAGHNTPTLPDSELQYFPLVSKSETIGVIGIRFEPDIVLSTDLQILLRSFLSQVTSSLEREMSIDKSKRKQIHEESQKLFQTVLNSISHELRTPISVISTAVSNLSDNKTAENTTYRTQICEDLNIAVSRLNILVENILDMSRVESGYLTLNVQGYEIDDLVGTVLNEVSNERHSQTIQLNIKNNIPLVRIDLSWMKQAIVNLVHNAFNYTHPDSIIELVALEENGKVKLEINDNGPGVPEASLAKLFEKFYRVPGSKSGGIGLGLTIVKAIIEAHHNEINVYNRPNGGLSFVITLDTFKNGEAEKQSLAH